MSFVVGGVLTFFLDKRWCFYDNTGNFVKVCDRGPFNVSSPHWITYKET